MSVRAGATPKGRGKKRPMTAGATKSLDGAKTRDHEVMEAAIDLFWEKGYASTSVQDVADSLGMLKGSLYYYIKGKEDLLKRIFQDSHDEGMAIIEAVHALDGPPRERLEAFLSQWSLWYLNNVKRTSLYAREWRHAGEGLREVLVEQRQYYDRTLTRLITDAQEDGALDKDVDAKMATYYIMSSISSLPDWYRPQGAKKADAVAASYVEFSLRLLGATTA